ncbi:MAG TPA: hypothetical protein VE467_14470 [Chryseolinea sp.]|nr:hypothetical protein [Chryseolinea sp.]
MQNVFSKIQTSGGPVGTDVGRKEINLRTNLSCRNILLNKKLYFVSDETLLNAATNVDTDGQIEIFTAETCGTLPP